ncbi:holin [Aquipseudomonas campi]
MAQQVHEGLLELGQAAASKATWLGAIVGVFGYLKSLFGWVADVNWIGLSGVLIALAGLGMNYYFSKRRDRREQAESNARIEALREQCGLGGPR